MKETKKRSYFRRYGSMIKNEFRGYNGSKFLKDVLAGLTVGAVALPLALAFGAASVDSDHAAIGIAAGLITAIVAGLVTGILGGGSFQISGPTGAMTVILGTIVAGQYGLQGMFVACFMAGFILLIAGIFRLGKLIDFIPKPVITGFTSGIAIVIALGQLGNFFGVKLVGETTIDKVIYFFRLSIGDINWKTVLCSLAVILIMVLFPKKWGKVIPSSLVAIILITLATTLLKLDVAKIGQIPASMLNSERLNFSSLSVDMVTSLIGPAFTIAVLGMIESLLCGVSAANMKKESFDADIELVAQGVGNLIVPILGGVPSTAAIARTSVAIKSGGQTRVASIIQSLFLIACMFLLSPLIAYVPYAALAGVLVVTAVKMNDWKDIKHYFSRKLWSSIVLFLITMVATVALDLTYAIFIGVGLSFIMFVVKLRTVDVYSELKKDLKTVGVYATGQLYFASVDSFLESVKEIDCDFDRVIIDLSGVTYIDVSALEKMLEFFRELNEKKVVLFAGVRKDVFKAIARDGFYKDFGSESFFSSFADAYKTKFKPRIVEKTAEEVLNEAALTAEKTAKIEKEAEKEFDERDDEQMVKKDDEVITTVIPPSVK